MEEREGEGRREIVYPFHLLGADTMSCTDRRQHGQCFQLVSLVRAVLQGKYDGMTFWEQLDDGVQNTSNRKFLTLVPVVLFLLATHGTDYRCDVMQPA